MTYFWMVPSLISDPRLQPHFQWISKMGLKFQLVPGSFLVKVEVSLCYWSPLHWEAQNWAGISLYNHTILHRHGKDVNFQLFQAGTIFYSTSAHTLAKRSCSLRLTVVVIQTRLVHLLETFLSEATLMHRPAHCPQDVRCLPADCERSHFPVDGTGPPWNRKWEQVQPYPFQLLMLLSLG